MITADHARNNALEARRKANEELQAAAVAICEEQISPLIKSASADGKNATCFQFGENFSQINSRVVKVLESNHFAVRLENGGRCITISW